MREGGSKRERVREGMVVVVVGVMWVGGGGGGGVDGKSEREIEILYLSLYVIQQANHR